MGTCLLYFFKFNIPYWHNPYLLTSFCCYFVLLGKDKDFTYRLTGKDARLILHGFMYLINAILGDSCDVSLLVRLLCLVFIAIKLRDCASRFSMYNITPDAIVELEKMSKQYFTAVSLFSAKIPGTVWHIMVLWEIWSWPWHEYNARKGSQACSNGQLCQKQSVQTTLAACHQTWLCQ